MCSVPYDVRPVNELSYHILTAFGMHYRKNNVILTFHLRYAVDHALDYEGISLPADALATVCF